MQGNNHQRHRVVITGVGAITPIGLSVAEFWTNALAGKSGAGKITAFDASGYDTQIACEVKGFDPLQFIDRKSVNRMDLFTQYAMACAEMAVKDAAIDFEKVDRNRVGVVFGF